MSKAILKRSIRRDSNNGLDAKSKAQCRKNAEEFRAAMKNVYGIELNELGESAEPVVESKLNEDEADWDMLVKLAQEISGDRNVLSEEDHAINEAVKEDDEAPSDVKLPPIAPVSMSDLDAKINDVRATVDVLKKKDIAKESLNESESSHESGSDCLFSSGLMDRFKELDDLNAELDEIIASKK